MRYTLAFITGLLLACLLWRYAPGLGRKFLGSYFASPY